MEAWKNQLFFGDNLDILRSGRIPVGSVDLIYLDPPFNSNATYNISPTTASPKSRFSPSPTSLPEKNWTIPILRPRKPSKKPPAAAKAPPTKKSRGN
jgi:hypothetical protein